MDKIDRMSLSERLKIAKKSSPSEGESIGPMIHVCDEFVGRGKKVDAAIKAILNGAARPTITNHYPLYYNFGRAVEKAIRTIEDASYLRAQIKHLQFGYLAKKTEPSILAEITEFLLKENPSWKP